MSGGFDVPYICDGEIVKCNGVNDTEAFVTQYTILMRWKDGTESILVNVPVITMFGGIGDYSHIRARQSFDEDKAWFEDMYSTQERRRSPGDRVLVSFINGDVKKPIIIGFYPHIGRKNEEATMDLPEPDNDAPQMTIKYLGIETEVNPAGELTLTHRGAPSVSWDGSVDPEAIDETGPTELPERSAQDGEALPVNDPTLPEKAQALVDNAFEDPFGNPQLVYPDAKYTTRQSFLERGEWYVCDSEGQQFFLDRDSQTITITNGNDTIQIDKANKSIFISSSGNIETHSAEDSVTQTDNNSYATTQQDDIKTVNGNSWTSIGGDEDKKTTGNFTGKNTGTWSLNCEGEFYKVEMSSGSLLKLDDSSGNESITLNHTSGSQTVYDSKGNITTTGSDGSQVVISAEDGKITVSTSKGASIVIDDKILISDATGNQTVSVADSDIEINAAANINLTCDTVNLNSGTVNLGKNVSFSSVLGENLQSWLDGHIHLTGVGPSAPPTILSSSLKGTPADILSSNVKLLGNL